MAARSAGILLYRRDGDEVAVLLVHPGGPFWAKKDVGAWSIPKGEYLEGDDPEIVARHEFEEELGMRLDAELIPLGELVQKGGKHVRAFAAKGDFDVSALASNTFDLEWPPRSGRTQVFPEVDRADWFAVQEARTRILASQLPFLDRLEELLSGPPV